MKYFEEVSDRRHKTPKATLFLTFYAGEAKTGNHIFMNFNKYGDKKNQKFYVEEMKQCL